MSYKKAAGENLAAFWRLMESLIIIHEYKAAKGIHLYRRKHLA
ncbi:hypothetical protein [Bacillus sp. ISL-55]|nr:hypothetical protein [Bacillus sp. ISL-55]